MKYMRFLALSLKRTVKNPVFIAVTAFLVISFISLSYMTDISKMKLDFAYCGNVQLPSTKYIVFTKYDDEKSLKKAVDNYIVDSGFSFGDDFDSKVFKDKNLEIKLFRRSDSIAWALASELIFSEMTSLYGDRIFEKSLVESGVSYETKFDENSVKEAASKYREDGGTFRFEYESVQGGRQALNVKIFPFKFATAVLAAFLLFSSVLRLIADVKSGIFSRMGFLEKLPYYAICALNPFLIYVPLIAFMYRRLLI